MKKKTLHPPIGAHMSIAGGYYKSVERAVEAGCECVQLFTKNNNQWRAKDITDDDAGQFQQAIKESGFKHSLSHVSYLVNMASPNLELWKKSIAAMVVELQRADRLGIPYVVVHPGAYTTSDEESGLARIAEALDAIHDEIGECTTQCLLETTAGQGSVLGARFEHLATIIDKADQSERLGVCFDTCHSFSAGYAMTTPAEYKKTMKEFDDIVGLDRLKAMHLNDSLKPFGAHKDRHAHIGQGEMGLEPFRHIMNDRRLRKIPMYLETPKGEDEQGRDLDVVNLKRLRSLVKK